MKKYGLRFLAGLATFFIGVVCSSMFSSFTQPDCVLYVNTPTQNITAPVSQNGKVEIRLKGYGRIENRPTLIFEITNHNSKLAKYLSYSERDILPSVKFNGKKIGGYKCGTGLNFFNLQPGETFTIEVMADIYILEFLKTRGSFQFGHYFGFGEQESIEFWSDPITISDEWKKDIIENAPSYLKDRF